MDKATAATASPSRPIPDPVTGIPSSYSRASWRSTLPVSRDGKRIGMGFDVDGRKEPLRIHMSVGDARNLAETLLGYLAEERVQADKSREIPSSEETISSGRE